MKLSMTAQEKDVILIQVTA